MNRGTSEETIAAAKHDYEQNGASQRKLVRKYGRSRNFWKKRIEEENWVQKQNMAEVPQCATDKEEAQRRFDGILSTVAVRKIKEIVEELGNHYSPIDEPVLVVYAKSYEYFIKLSKTVDEEGISLVSPKTGSLYANPNFNSWLAVGKNIAAIGEKIGVTEAARRRIGITLGADDKTESLFDFVEKMMDEDIDV